MTDSHVIERLTSLDDAAIDGLAAVLVDAVGGGGSVSFLAPLAHADAVAFWRRQDPGPRGAIFVARAADRAIDGVVMLAPAWPPNQPHRADVAKLMVHRRARRRGLAGRLMQALEDHARDGGFELLTLDTVRGDDAERLYRARGWTEAGSIPDYALLPDGRGYADTVLFYKRVSPRSAR